MEFYLWLSDIRWYFSFFFFFSVVCSSQVLVLFFCSFSPLLLAFLFFFILLLYVYVLQLRFSWDYLGPYCACGQKKKQKKTRNWWEPLLVESSPIQHGETLYREVNLSNMIYTQHLQHTQSHIYLCVCVCIYLYLSVIHSLRNMYGRQGEMLLCVCAARSRAGRFFSLSNRAATAGEPTKWDKVVSGEYSAQPTQATQAAFNRRNKIRRTGGEKKKKFIFLPLSRSLLVVGKKKEKVKKSPLGL